MKLSLKRSTATALFIITAVPAVAQEDAGAVVGAGVGLVLGLVITILIGALVGWSAGRIVGGSGTGFWGDVAFGIGGSIIASKLLPLLGISFGGMVGSLVAALIGAILLILIVRQISKAVGS